MKRVSVGFSLRVNPEEQPGNVFPENQRLVPQISSPICADPSVSIEPAGIDHLMGGTLPDFANPLGLAKNIDPLIKACKEHGISTTGLWPVCVTCSEADVIGLVERYGPGYFENQPREEELVTLGWRFMGFDIVDFSGLISGLKGCGYIEPTWGQLENRFRGDLNEVGLFKDSLAASEFAKIRETQIRKHAPFVVVGILKQDPI